MKACQIFKTEKEYKIITMYRTDTDSYKLMDPIIILPKEIEKEKLADSIFNSLSSSVLIKNPNYDNSKMLLKKIKETSFNKFYQKSKCCMLFVEKNKVLIEPQMYSLKLRALLPVQDKATTVDINSKTEVVEEVLRLLKE